MNKGRAIGLATMAVGLAASYLKIEGTWMVLIVGAILTLTA